MGQLGSKRQMLSEGLRILYDQVQEWDRNCKFPTLIPVSRCLPFPGSDVRLTINVNIAFLGGKNYKDIF